MLKEKDLKILNYLLEELNKLGFHSSLGITSLPDWYMENLKIEKMTPLHYKEVERLFNIFHDYGLGEFKNHNGRLSLHSTYKSHDENFDAIFNKQKEKLSKEIIEAEKLILDVKLNKWLIKTKWLPHIVAGISIVISIISFYYNQNEFENEINELRERIERIENTELVRKDV